VNVQTFQAVQKVDEAVVGPAAEGFRKVVPSPVRSGLRNALFNLGEPIVAINFLLQHRVGRAAETVGRFALNSTIGVIGTVDIAKREPFHLPRRQNGFADTMGYYGVGPGAYLFLPLVGPTTTRDAIGGVVDHLFLSFAVGVPFNELAYSLSTGAVHALDRRNRIDAQLRAERQSADTYVAVRDLYLHQRNEEILNLHSPGYRVAQGEPSLATGK
jgi:phospholipid-binding lipoprotein MlaA